MKINNPFRLYKSPFFFNNFGKYKYRSCEDILEALKPILDKNNLALFISDEMEILNSRYYVRATAHLINVEKPEEIIKITALAREEESKKGMDGSQITGASSSYARKYALNGLFAIDDTKDSDSTNTYDNNSANNKDKLIKEIMKDTTKEEEEILQNALAYYKRKDLKECAIEELKIIKAKLESERKKRG